MVEVKGPFSQHLIFFVTCEWAQQARVFVPGKPYQQSLMFVGKAGAFPSETPQG